MGKGQALFCPRSFALAYPSAWPSSPTFCLVGSFLTFMLKCHLIKAFSDCFI